MKTTILLFKTIVFFSAVVLVSCSKVEPENFKKAETVPVVNVQTASRNFSIALSKAVCSHEEVREFLKKEALKSMCDMSLIRVYVDIVCKSNFFSPAFLCVTLL